MSLASQPITRSRTLLFLSYRDSRASTSYPPSQSYDRKGKGRARGEEGERLLDGNTVVDMDDDDEGRLPPKWVDYSDQVELLVEGIKPKMAHLDRLTAKHVLPGFTDRTAEEHEIDSMTNDITRDFRTCQSHIRKIADFTKYMQIVMKRPTPPPQGPSTGKRRETYTDRDIVMATNVQIALATKVQELSALFRKRQSNYLKQLKGYELQTQDLLAASGAVPLKDPLLALEADESLSQDSLYQTQTQAQQQRLPQNDSLIRERDREITGIAQSIAELADLFKDLSGLVIDQGTLLDRVDYNVEQMNTHVKGAVEELKAATQYQRRTGKCRLIFLLVLLICGAIIVLIYKPHRSSSSPSEPVETPTIPTTETLPVVALDASEVGRREGLEGWQGQRVRRVVEGKWDRRRRVGWGWGIQVGVDGFYAFEWLE